MMHWYALHSKPRKEDFLWHQLSTNNVESYYPILKVRRAKTCKQKSSPYFPQYLFVHLDFENTSISELKWMPGVLCLVSFGGEPAQISDQLIKLLQQRIDIINAGNEEYLDNLKPGDLVTIQDGPFRGYEAVFNSRITGSERVRCMLKMVQDRQILITLPSKYTHRKKTALILTR